MELTPLEKEIVVKILRKADGEDLDEIVKESDTSDWILRSFFLRADSETIMDLLREKLNLCRWKE